MLKELDDWKKLHDFHLYSGAYETKDLAAFLNVSTRTVQRWLKGTAQPDRHQLAQIGKYLLENNTGGERDGNDGP